MPNPTRLGFGGLPIGEAAGNQRQPKQATPCSAFRNTHNQETHMNTQMFMNTSRAFNHGATITFKSSDDILTILRTHPDFIRLPKDRADAILAAILSGLVAGGGLVVLFFVSGGAAAASAPLLIKTVGSGLLTAGATGQVVSSITV